jgi:hypothetical protein
VRNNNNFRVYIDGGLEINYTDTIPIGSCDNTAPVNIGRMWTSATLEGKVGMGCTFNTNLSSDQIAAIYNATKSKYGHT